MVASNVSKLHYQRNIANAYAINTNIDIAAAIS